MRVIHRSDTLLVLEDRPWFIGIFMIAMALVFLAASMALISEGLVLGGVFMGLLGGGVPVLIGALMVRRVRLTFDRQAGRLIRTSRSVSGLQRGEYALDRLVEAKVGVSYDSDGNTYRTELSLRDPPETVPFTSYYTSGKKPDRMTEAINDWLTAPKGPRAAQTATDNP
ncbi:MAG: hypothetical protein MUE83_00015 [Tabrizicola sp.]|jgi:hypothetical protein|nr:hypothetical protein [Tabrizicola sp.]